MNEHTPPPPDVPAFGDGLLPEDGDALEALVNAGFDVRSAVRSAPQGKERLERLAALLKTLDSTAASDRSLADVTFARVMQARGQGAAVREVALSPDDDAALESMVMSGFEVSRVPGTLRERAKRHDGLARLVTQSGRGAPADGTLVDRTLTRIQAHIDVEASVLRVDAPRASRGPGGRGFRLTDLVSVAALLLIGTGVAMPVLSATREASRRTLCQANLGTTATAMTTYAGAYRDSLPVANASLGPTWWDVKPHESRSNSANLFALKKGGYLSLEALACPGNPTAATTAPEDACDWNSLDEVSYSYQIMAGQSRPAWRQAGPSVVLADRSPVIGPARRGEAVMDPFANAPNHKGSGQHVLCLDASVCWETSPVLRNGDNIWLPRGLEQYVNQLSVDRRRQAPPLKGNEAPAGSDDTFLGP